MATKVVARGSSPVRAVVRPTTVKSVGGPQGPPGDGALPPATQQCQVLFSVDGSTFEPVLPVTNANGWLVNNGGCLIVNNA